MGLIKEFDSVAQRVLYGLRFVYADFVAVESDLVSAGSQQRLHELMGRMLGRLYEEPGLLELPDNPDEAYEWHLCNNQKPALNAVFLAVCKPIYEFYKFLYITALRGELRGGALSVGGDVLKQNKAGYKPCFGNLLRQAGIEAVKDKNGVTLNAGGEVLAALKLLAERVPVDPDPWHPYALEDFARCSFDGGKAYLIERIDNVNGWNGLLTGLQKECLENGYEQEIKLSLGAAGQGLDIYLKNKVGGFQTGYNPRKYQQFYFGTINGIGEKAMLTDFDSLDGDIRRHFISICRRCNGCLICTKSGKNKKFTVEVTYDGTAYKLCPSYPRHSWEAPDPKLIGVLLKYHELQEKYALK